MEILLIIFAFLMIGAALAGIVFPFLPGAPLAWIGILVYAGATDFSRISVNEVLWLGLLAVLTLFLDVLGPVLGLKNRQASRYAVIGAVVGAIAGIPIFGPLGIILGPFLGALAGELIAGRTKEHALRSAYGALIGFVFGSLLKIAVVIAMAGYFTYTLVF